MYGVAVEPANLSQWVSYQLAPIMTTRECAFGSWTEVSAVRPLEPGSFAALRRTCLGRCPQSERPGLTYLWPIKGQPLKGMTAVCTCPAALISVLRKRMLGLSLGAERNVEKLYAVTYTVITSILVGAEQWARVTPEFMTAKWDSAKRNRWLEERQRKTGDPVAWLRRCRVFVKDEAVNREKVAHDAHATPFSKFTPERRHRGFKFPHLICNPHGAAWDRAVKGLEVLVKKRAHSFRFIFQLKNQSAAQKQVAIRRLWQQVCGTDKQSLIIGFDGAEWDASLPAVATALEAGILTRVMSQKERDAYLRYTAGQRFSFGKRRGCVRMVGKRRSGDPYTSGGNGLVNLCIQLTALAYALSIEDDFEETLAKLIGGWGRTVAVITEGDDALIFLSSGLQFGPYHLDKYNRLLHAFGVRTKLEMRKGNAPMSPEFCGVHFIGPAGPQTPNCLPAARRTYRKFLTSVNIGSVNRPIASMARLKAMSLNAQFGDMPFWGHLAAVSLSLYPQGRVTTRDIIRFGQYSMLSSYETIDEVKDALFAKLEPRNVDSSLIKLVATSFGVTNDVVLEEIRFLPQILTGQRRSQILK